LKRVRRVLLFGVLAGTMAATGAPAWGAVTPGISLDQSAGHAAGSTANLGLDLKFTNSGTDSPQHLTIDLPPGLLADASIDGGACLTTANVSGSTCQVGSGTVTATPDPIPGVLDLPFSVSVPVAFYLVPPPAAGDLAGLAVEGLGQQLGSTGEIKIRPSGDPAGVGVTLKLVLPDQLPLTLPVLGTINAAQISLTEINSTFDQLRYPTTCPATPAQLTASVDSYGDPTVHTASAPLSVTGCGSLPYAPAFSVTAARDSGDAQVALTTRVTQPAGEAPSGTVSLAFPNTVLVPNVGALAVSCASPSSGSCTPVGSVSATSPLYPTPLSGTAYLTGTLGDLSLVLVFPSPFPLTLTGSIDLTRNASTFTGLPDIPLTNLAVTLNGGAHGLFQATCAPASGTGTATLTDQNGDRTVTAPSGFTVSGCPAGAGAPSPGAPNGGGSTGGGTGSSAPGQVSTRPRLTGGRWSGLGTGRPSLSFTLSVTPRAPKLASLTVELPAGLGFTRHREHRRLVFTGVRLIGAQIKSLSLSHGHLVITLRRPASRVTVKLAPSALHESAALRSRASKLHSLRLIVIAQSTSAKRWTIRTQLPTRV
jgi:hypothetical protein